MLNATTWDVSTGALTPTITLWRGTSILLLLYIIASSWRSYRRLRAMPPGPRGLPILGNVLQMPSSQQWLKFSEWNKEYGPVFSLNLAGQPLVVLNSFKSAADLLDRRSSIYSDRPRLVMVQEVLCGNVFMILSRYGDQWRRMRRATHEAFNTKMVEKYRPVQAREAAFAVLRMLENPDDWQNHLKRAAGSSILGAVYAWPSITDSQNPLVQRIHAFSNTISAAVVPGAYLIDIFPVLDHLPTWMYRPKKKGQEWHENETDLFRTLLKDVEDKLDIGSVGECLVCDLKERNERNRLSEKEIAWLSGIMFAAGMETTSGTLAFFILAAVLYPEVVAKAREELDEVVGRSRLPSFDDLPQLPYIQAVVKELLRWRPVAPLGVPHSTTEDDWYEGYLIPKGTIIFANIWSMNRDPEYFPDYSEFRPERYLDGDIPEDTHNMGHASFGFGRRICVGQNFAMQLLHINIATLLWALNIDKVMDANNNEIMTPKNDFVDSGVIMEPAPFKCKMTPRFPEAVDIIKKTFLV
ncbi:cytochrome P450 [Agrocybe pediades]|nr:cytochrome P450 [Agrocybe pediades]